MRKILLFLLVAVVIGCTKDTLSKQILGNWALVDYTCVNARTNNQMSAATDVKMWTFTNSGSAYVNGSTPLTYTLNGKRLSVTYVNNGKVIDYDIEELSSTTLKVYWFEKMGKNQDNLHCWYTFTKMK